MTGIQFNTGMAGSPSSHQKQVTLQSNTALNNPEGEENAIVRGRTGSDETHDIEALKGDPDEVAERMERLRIETDAAFAAALELQERQKLKEASIAEGEIAVSMSQPANASSALLGSLSSNDSDGIGSIAGSRSGPLDFSQSGNRGGQDQRKKDPPPESGDAPTEEK